MQKYRNVSKLPVRVVVGDTSVTIQPGKERCLPRSVDVKFHEKSKALRRVKEVRPMPKKQIIEKKEVKKEKVEKKKIKKKSIKKKKK